MAAFLTFTKNNTFQRILTFVKRIYASQSLKHFPSTQLGELLTFTRLTVFSELLKLGKVRLGHVLFQRVGTALGPPAACSARRASTCPSHTALMALGAHDSPSKTYLYPVLPWSSLTCGKICFIVKTSPSREPEHRSLICMATLLTFRPLNIHNM